MMGSSSVTERDDLMPASSALSRVRSARKSDTASASAERSAGSFFREGHALENIRQRLRLHYRDEALLTVTFPGLDAVAVTITGPLQ